MPEGTLLYSLAATSPGYQSEQVPTLLPFQLKVTPGWIDHLAPSISYMGVPWVSSI